MNEQNEAAKRLRNKADECRAMAEHMANAISRDSFLQMARGYDHLAEQIERIESIRQAKLRAS